MVTLMQRRREMMRLASGPAPGPSIDDYVQTGLVFWLDAINNTRSGHDASSAKWHDLADGNDVTYNANAVIADKYCIPNGDSAGTKITVTSSYTMELVFELVSNGSAQLILPWNKNAYGTLWIGSGGNVFFSAGSGSNAKGVVFRSGVNTYAARGLSAMSVNGEAESVISTAATWSNAYNKLFDYNPTYPRPCVSKISAIRIYNRLLTDAEIAQNAAVDAARFGG